MNRHSLLRNDWAVVDTFIGHKMHHDSGFASSAVRELGKCALNGMNTWQLARKCGMNVDDLIRKLREKGVGQDTHKACEHDDVGLPSTNDLCKARIVLRASLVRFCSNNCCLYVVAFRTIQCKRFVFVGNNTNYLGVKLLHCVDCCIARVDDGLQVGAVSGRKNHKPRGHESETRPCWLEVWCTRLPMIKVGSLIADCTAATSLGATIITMPMPILSVR